MSDAFTSAARDQRSVLERLIKGLPGISGYTDKELRRDADYRLRQLIANELDGQRATLLDVQNRLLNSGGLAFLSQLDGATGRVQTLADRVRTASYGYAGFFDAVRVREQELDALHRFDVALLQAVAGLDGATAALRSGLDDRAGLGGAIDKVVEEVAQLTALFGKREQAISSPELLTSAGYAPDVRAPEGSDAAPLAAVPDLAAPDVAATDAGGYSPVFPPAAPSAAPAQAVDAGDYTLLPSGESPAAPMSSGDVPSGFELIETDKP